MCYVVTKKYCDALWVQVYNFEVNGQIHYKTLAEAIPEKKAVTYTRTWECEELCIIQERQIHVTRHYSKFLDMKQYLDGMDRK